MRNDYQHLYKTKKWGHLRRRQLEKYPFCQCPHHKGQHIEANVVDHIRPHKGDLRLFWASWNLQSMAKQCHDRYKASQERGGKGFLGACDASGQPIAKEHEWYAARE